MLDNILRWLGAGDQAITSMGPSMVVILSLLGGLAVTQVFKFPLALLLKSRWTDWVIRFVAILSTMIFMCWLDHLPIALDVIVGLSAPLAYRAVTATLRHFWPWLEAGKVLGSAAPSQTSQDALAQRKRDK